MDLVISFGVLTPENAIDSILCTCLCEVSDYFMMVSESSYLDRIDFSIYFLQ